MVNYHYDISPSRQNLSGGYFEGVNRLNTKELLKKSLAFTLGAASFSSEKLKQFADEMVSRGEMTKEDATEFIDDVSKQAAEEKQSIESWLREQTTKMVQQVGAIDKTSFEKLEKRVALLEAKLAGGVEEVCECEEEDVCIIDSTTGECAREHTAGE